MPGTILRNTTGPFVSQPFLIPPGHSLALSIAGSGFGAILEGTLDADSTDWVQAGPTFAAATLYNTPIGPIKFRLNVLSGTVVSAQYSSSLVQVQQVSGLYAGVDYSAVVDVAGLSVLTSVVTIPPIYSSLPDATSAIQVLLNALPTGGVLDGGNRTHTVTSLLLKNDMQLRNVKFLTLAGTTDFVAPITIDGRPVTADLNSGLKQNIVLRNVQVNGNRANQLAIVSSAEDGGRHGMRVIGRVANLLIEDCSARYCGSDGLEMYSWTGRNQSDDTDPAFRNIIIRRSSFDFNRRHGASFDSLRGVRIESGCTFNDNGLDLPGVTGATPTTAGLRGDPAPNTQLYGNGIDVEGYGVGSGVDGMWLDNIEALRNARGGLLFYDNTDQAAAGFRPRNNITISRCKVDKGLAVGSTGEAITFTSTIGHKLGGKLYDNITLRDNDITGFVLARTVGVMFIAGGSIDHTSNPLIADHCGIITLSSGINYKNNSLPYADTATFLQDVTKDLAATGGAVATPIPMGTEVRSNGPASDQFALLTTLPAGGGNLNRAQVELLGGGYNGAQQQNARISMSNFNGFGYLFERAGPGALGFGVTAYQQGDGTVQVYVKAGAGKFVYGLVRSVLQLFPAPPSSLTPGAFSGVVPSGTLVLDTTDTATYPAADVSALLTRVSVLETKLTPPLPPTVTYVAGTTGALSAVAMTLRSLTPTTLTYYWNAVWTPTSTGAANFSKFDVGYPSGYYPSVIQPGSTDRITGASAAVGVNGAGGTAFTLNNTSASLELSVFITLYKI